MSKKPHVDDPLNECLDLLVMMGKYFESWTGENWWNEIQPVRKDIGIRHPQYAYLGVLCANICFLSRLNASKNKIWSLK